VIVGDALLIFNYSVPAGYMSIIIGLAILYLQYKAHWSPTTQVQRWGMTLLAWLFLANGISAVVWVYAESTEASLFLYFVYLDLPCIAPMFLITFSLVFPQSVVRPNRIWMLFLFMTCVMALVIAMEVGHNVAFGPIAEADLGVLKDTFIYMGWIVSIYRWILLYRKSGTHPETSLITSILVWAIWFHVIINLFFDPMSGVPAAQWGKVLVFGLDLKQFLVLLAMVLILHQLYERRGNWGMAERLHLYMFGLVLFLVISTKIVSKATSAGHDVGSFGAILYYIKGEGGMTIVRPALIIYALLRYQFFGHELKAEKVITCITTIMMAYFGGLFISLHFNNAEVVMRAAIALGACVVLLAPAYWASKRLIRRLIPSSRKMTRKEVRDIYSMTFNSALFKGKITDKRDEVALKSLRKRLKISEREHNLLLESESLRSLEGRPAHQIRHVIFIKDTGLHVTSIGATKDTDDTVLAGMLTAVRMFVKDAFGSSTGDLDTIQYGERKLLMEWERGYIIAVDLEGELDPASRVIAGDLLAIVMRRHWKVLREWEGDMNEVQPIQEDLDRMVQRYNTRGTF
jgi:hypothetical protein